MTNAIDVSTLSFEQALKELEGIVARLEQGSVPLEESIPSTNAAMRFASIATAC